MYKIDLEIEVLSPLAVGYQKPSSSISEALDYIPGSVIRGAIASVMMQLSGNSPPEDNDDFHALFTSEESAIFQNAYPASLQIKSKNIPSDRIESINVIPATALSSKAQEGFKTQEGKGVFDTLIDRFCAEGYGYPYDPTDLEGGRVDVFSGFYCEFNKKPYKLSSSKRLLTRTGINRRRATSEESILYSIEVLNESSQQQGEEKPAIYRGAILIKDQKLGHDLVEFISKFSHLIRLGGSKSRGLGKVSIKPTKPPLKQVESHLDSRLKQFNNKLKERWKQWQIFNPRQPKIDDDHTFFTLNLQSDAILQENWLKTTVISEDMLQSYLGVKDPSLTLETAYSSYDYISGWNSAWGRMKDVELITRKGSAYLFSTHQPSLWIELLKQLELTGIGDRISEGFGQVQICSPFHLILREEAK